MKYLVTYYFEYLAHKPDKPVTEVLEGSVGEWFEKLTKEATFSDYDRKLVVMNSEKIE